MSLQLVDKEECSSIENRGTRKLDRRDTYKLMVEKKLKKEEFKTEISVVSNRRHNVFVDPKLGIIRIKKIKYDKINHYWAFGFSSKDTKEFDNLLCYCLDKDGCLERKYIIPRYDIKKAKFVIAKDLSKKRWYNKYRVNEDISILKET